MCFEISIAVVSETNKGSYEGLINGRMASISAGIYDPIFVKSIPFMLKAQIMQFFSIKEFLC